MNRLCLKYTAISFLFFFTLFFLFAGCSSDQQKAEDFIKEGKAYFEKEEYDKAKIQLKNAIQLIPASLEAYQLLAQTSLKLGDAQEAFSTFLRLEQLEPENLETKIQVASFYLLAKKRIEAEKRVDEVLAKSPDNIKALYLYAGILSSKKEAIEKITQIYDKILELDPKQVKAMLVLARVYQAQGKSDKAEATLKKAIEIDLDNINIYKTLFGFYLFQKNFDSAMTVLKNLALQRPNDFEPQIMLGNFYGARQENEKAESAFLKAVELAPEQVTPHMLIARFYNSIEDPQKAEKFIKKALTIDPAHAGLKIAYADFYFIHKDIENAQKLVNEVLAERPDYIPGKLLKGKLLAHGKKLDEALIIFQTLVKDEPDSPMYNFLLGSVLLEKRKPELALPYFTKTLEKNPRHFKARLMVADLHYRKGDYFLAETEIGKALAVQPKNYNALLLKGNIHGAQKEYDKAQTLFEDLIALDKENPSAYFRLGNINMLKKEPRAALENFEKALDINHNLMDVFTNIISFHASRKEYRTALDKCDAHLKIINDNPDGENPNDNNPIVSSIILNLKGNLLLATQELEPAKNTFKLSIEKNPQFIQPYLTLAKIYRSEKKGDKELQIYKDLIENRPDQAGPHSFIATLYEKTGELELAEDHYKKALAISPEYVPALNNLAFFYAQQDKELNKALDMARKAKELGGEVTAIMDTLGWVYYKKELYDSALLEFKSCIEKEPENPVFHYHMGLAYNKKWDYANAEKALEKALELQNDFNGADEARKILDQM
jgi:tetratricopeptide (TPR) repeat protein